MHERCDRGEHLRHILQDIRHLKKHAVATLLPVNHPKSRAVTFSVEMYYPVFEWRC